MGKRANGESSYRQRPNGSWEARMSYVDPATGDRVRRSFYGRTKGDVREQVRKARERVDAGAPVRDATTTVADWLEHWRKTTLAVSDRKESTRVLYAGLSRTHLDPAPFGAIPLDRLRPSDIEALVLRMRSATKPGPAAEDGSPGAPVRTCSDSTIRTTYTVLRAALDGAVRDQLLARNPAAQVQRPGVARTEARYLDADAVGTLLTAASTSRYHPVLVLIAATGLRVGEAAALRWEAVDLDGGSLRVTATVRRVDGRLLVTEPKTARSRRTVPLTTPVVSMLRRHRTAQLAERMRAANVWQETGLVFTTESGTAVDPRNLLRVVEGAAKAAGSPGIGVHTLRHTAAVGMLESGVHIRAVADILGHSSIAVTGDVYGHTSDAAARAAMETLSTHLRLADGGGQ